MEALFRQLFRRNIWGGFWGGEKRHCIQHRRGENSGEKNRRIKMAEKAKKFGEKNRRKKSAKRRKGEKTTLSYFSILNRKNTTYF